MKAAVLRGLGQRLLIEDATLDVPREREVMIATAAAGICHSDLSVIDGTLPKELPLIVGHESAGVVVDVGSDVTYVRPGDHVITCVSTFCGACEFCLRGRAHLCAYAPDARRTSGRRPGLPARITVGGEGVNQQADLGSFAEQLLVDENAVVRIEDDIPLDHAVLLGCGVTAGLGAVLKTAQVRVGSTVAVLGCGGVGLAAIQGSRLAAARQIIAVDTRQESLALALSLGATNTVNAAEEDSVTSVRDLSGGGVDYSFEAVGSTDTVSQAFSMLQIGGTCTVLGALSGHTIKLDGGALQLERRIQGSIMGSTTFRVDLPQWLDLYRQGHLRLGELITARLRLGQVNEGLAALRRGEGIRTVIVFDQAMSDGLS